jgi:putative DNA primase/helicase
MIVANYENVRDALSYISPETEREEWVKVGTALKNGLNGEGFELFDEWSKSGSSYNAHDTRDTWKSINTSGGITVGTLFYLAKEGGWKPNADAKIETEAERLERESKAKAFAEKESKTKEEKAAAAVVKVKALIAQATPALENHPYLVKKGVKPESLLEMPADKVKTILGYAPKSDGKPLTGRLLIAQVEIDGNLSTAELIDEEGRKSAIAGGIKSCGYWCIRPLPANDDTTQTFVIGEGVATILTANEAFSAVSNEFSAVSVLFQNTPKATPLLDSEQSSVGSVGLSTDSTYFFIAALSANNLPKVAKHIHAKYPLSQLIILSDIGNGQKYAEQAARENKAGFAIPSFTPEQIQQFQNTNKNDKPPTDFNDLHSITGLGSVLAQISVTYSPDPKNSTKPVTPIIDFDEPIYGFPHTKDNGQKRATIGNLKFLFKEYGIKVNYDEMLKEQVMTLGNNYDNGHTDLIANSNISHLKSLLSLNGVPLSCIDLLPAIFSENASNPILDFFKSKQWDGKDRIVDLANTLTVAENDQSYAYLALKTWLIQCVAAADGARHTPRKDAIAKFELVFILQGGQGAKKTSWFGKLLPKELKNYIIDGVHLDPSDRDSVKQSTACWICELGELDSTFKRADISRLKAFLSKQTDILRLAYDRCASQLGRRTSFCGSVNPEQFLNDSTGARRFLPVQILACDYLHTINMQQLWAQLWSYYLNGYQWWCSKELEQILVEHHDRHAEINPIHEMIAEVFDIEKIEKSYNFKHYTATKILTECGIKDPKMAQVKFVSEFLKKCGFNDIKSHGIKGFWLKKRDFVPDE